VSIFSTISHICIYRRQQPPRSLLQLASAYSGEDTRAYSVMSASVALLRAPPSWAMAATMSLYSPCDKENTRARYSDNDTLSPVRAKCASGVPFLMSAMDETAVLSKRLEQSSPPSSPRTITTTQWELCQQILFGNFRMEEICTPSAFFATTS